MTNGNINIIEPNVVFDNNNSELNSISTNNCLECQVMFSLDGNFKTSYQESNKIRESLGLKPLNQIENSNNKKCKTIYFKMDIKSIIFIYWYIYIFIKN